MLKRLTGLCGVSGNEDEVREFIESEIKPYCDEIFTDKIGNLIAFKKGKSDKKKMMLSAHMDEVGFIIKSITEDGFLKFEAVGGVDSRILLGRRVLVGDDKVNGVIGIKAVHMTTADERARAVPIKDMYIDIGADSRDDAEKSADIGDYIAFAGEYIEFGEGKIKAKALDDRAGCAILAELIKTADFYYDTYCCFTVQEEVGCRGAQVAANIIKPDIALILEGTICADAHETPSHLHVSTMGGGGVLSVMERSSKSDKNFIKFISETAKTSGIPFQYKRTGNGGNEGGVIQTAGKGVITAVISLPCRYIHSPVSVADKKDFENTLKLAKAVTENMGGFIWSF